MTTPDQEPTDRIVNLDDRKWRTAFIRSVKQDLAHAETDIPFEGPRLRIRKVRFIGDEYDQQRAGIVKYLTGTVIPADGEGAWYLPERTLTIMRRMNIPFDIIIPS